MTKQLCTLLTGDFSGMTTEHILNNIPDGWKKIPVKSGLEKGWKLLDEREIERIRFMKPTKRYPNGYWIRLNEKRQFLDGKGNVIPREFTKSVRLRMQHIPYTGGENQLKGFDEL